MLQPVDLAVAFSAAYRRARDGEWSPKAVRDDLALAWSSLNLSLSRLDAANVVRGGRVNRPALAALLPALQYLVRAEPDYSRRERGLPTSVSAPIFEGRIVAGDPFVWPFDGGTVEGIPIAPLHPTIPGAVVEDAGRYALFACVDALRGGKAREVRLAEQHLWNLLDLPAAVVPA